MFASKGSGCSQMVFLTVGALMKNEAHCIVEWIEHYLEHGVEHFWLIDDESTDKSVELVQTYIERGLVTLFQSNWARYHGRQRAMYTHYFLPKLRARETEWLLMVDLDEFMWSPHSHDMKAILRQVPHLGQIQVQATVFGSNGLEKQPPFLVEGFTRRSKELETVAPSCTKYFVHSSFEFHTLNVHHAEFSKKSDESPHTFQRLGDPYFRLNHYSVQSREFWERVKMTRGDSDQYLERNEGVWKHYNQNDVEDFALLERNRDLLNKLRAGSTV